MTLHISTRFGVTNNTNYYTCHCIFWRVKLGIWQGAYWLWTRSGERSLYQAIGDDEDDQESPFNSSNTDSDYYEPDEFQQKFSNIQSVSSDFHSNWDDFRKLLYDLQGEKLAIDFIGIT